MHIVDTHPHVISNDHTQYPLAPVGGKLSGWAQDRPVTGEQMLTAMDEAGVTQAALVQASTAHGYDNRYTAECARSHTDRFVGVCCVDALAPDGPDRLSEWVEEWGMAGLRVYTGGTTMPEGTTWLDDPASFPTWERTQQLGIPVNAQTRWLSAGEPSMPRVRNLLERFSGVRVILDHLAKPPIEDGPPFTAAQALFDLAEFPNLYLKLTTDNLKNYSKTPESRQFLQKVVAVFGGNRIIWGSDFPAVKESLVECVRIAQSALSILPEADRRAIFAETALSLYPALGRTAAPPQSSATAAR